MVVMMTGTSLYNSDVFISHFDFYEWLAVNLKELCLLYVFLMKYLTFWDIKFTHWWMLTHFLPVLGLSGIPVQCCLSWVQRFLDISTLAFNNMFMVFIIEHYADGCLSLPCFLKKYIVVLSCWWRAWKFFFYYLLTLRHFGFRRLEKNA